MKCSIMLYFIRVFTVSKSSRVGVSRIQMVNQYQAQQNEMFGLIWIQTV